MGNEFAVAIGFLDNLLRNSPGLSGVTITRDPIDESIKTGVVIRSYGAEDDTTVFPFDRLGSRLTFQVLAFVPGRDLEELNALASALDGAIQGKSGNAPGGVVFGVHRRRALNFADPSKGSRRSFMGGIYAVDVRSNE